MFKDNVLLLANCFFFKKYIRMLHFVFSDSKIKLMELNSSLAGVRYTRSAERNFTLINFTAFKTQMSLFQDTF